MRPTTAPRWSTASSAGARRSSFAARSASIEGGSVTSASLAHRLPTSVGPVDQPLVEQHANRLLDEERIPFGHRLDANRDFRRDLIAEEIGDQGAGRLVGQRLELDRACTP